MQLTIMIIGMKMTSVLFHYVHPQVNVFPEIRLDIDEVLHVGREPQSDTCGRCKKSGGVAEKFITLFDSKETDVSRVALCIQLLKEGLRIENENRNNSVDVKVSSAVAAPVSLPSGHAIILPPVYPTSDDCIVDHFPSDDERVIQLSFQGNITIANSRNKILFEWDNFEIKSPPFPEAVGVPTNTKSYEQGIWDALSEPYKQLCSALLASYFCDVFTFPKDTVPDDSQKALLLGIDDKAVKNRIVRTKDYLKDFLPYDFAGAQGVQELANWARKFVREEDVKALPGYDSFLNREKT